MTASDRTDLPRLLATLQNSIAADVAGALDTKLRRLGVQLEVDTTKTKASEITV